MTSQDTNVKYTSQEKALLDLLLDEPYVTQRCYQRIRQLRGQSNGLKVHIHRLRSKGVPVKHRPTLGYYIPKQDAEGLVA